MANQRSAGILGACERAMRQLVLHGLATVRMRTLGPAASFRAWPWWHEDLAVGDDQVGAAHALLAGEPADQDDPVGTFEGLRAWSVATTSVSSGNAQSSSSMRMPFSAGSAAVISRSRSSTGWSGPNRPPEAIRKIKA